LIDLTWRLPIDLLIELFVRLLFTRIFLMSQDSFVSDLRLDFLNTLGNYFPLLLNQNKVTNEQLAILIRDTSKWHYFSDKEMQILSVLREYLND